MRLPFVALLPLLCGLGCGRFGFDELPGVGGSESTFAPGAAGDPRSDAGVDDAVETDGSNTQGDASTSGEAGPMGSSCAGTSLTPKQWFTFEGTGEIVSDAMGGADGTAVGTTLTGTGGIELTTPGAHIDLPARELRADTPSTALYWLVWRGAAEQPVFYVQKPLLSLNVTALPASVTLLTSPTGLTLRYEVLEGSQEIVSPVPLIAGKLTHLAISYDETKREVSLYVDGELVASGVLQRSSTDVIYGERVWLGHKGDDAASFEGRFEDLRVVPQALSACQIREAYRAGPNSKDLCADCPAP